MALQHLAEEKFLFLTTIGRTSGLPREIEIWFIVCRERFYLFAEKGEAAGWVKNIRRNPAVTVRIGARQIDATARVLHRQTDRELWKEVAAIAERKYGWGDGLPVEITPVSSS
jgi:deazaflavin-dependent oxidoreductase (nitroreductase family)